MAQRQSIRAAVALLVLSIFGITNVVAENSAGCGKSPTLTSGQRTLQVNGKTRQWILTLPANYNNTNPYRLIFGVHWLDGDYTMVANDTNGPYYGIQAQANNTAIFVAPNGLNKGWANSGGEDIAFFDAMLSTLQADLCINTKLIHTTGFSYGGSMSYALACARPNVFRAVAILSGANLSGCSPGTQPVAYYGQHGVSDSVLNISGGRSLRDTFVRNNGCNAMSPSEPKSGSKTHTITKYSGCKEGYPVEWVAFDGTHVGTPLDAGGYGKDTWTSAEVWRFFTQFTT
jgi:poly(3-hydroxybutyrate) depolymerase